eukprot:CAMPEP_0175441662 /NCGR_PEP_ID=MMETSP0095-20121207/57725_1 /TAXON_ID=311494 /ORGANISM="Alexandrium monilatum, Strain CCMP3105" /LENGTH=183 /DNA_ID=CAMNT_0016741621 /DNA_START=145 /DNA_END=694 /DNA_ORIENTATION=+
MAVLRLNCGCGRLIAVSSARLDGLPQVAASAPPLQERRACRRCPLRLQAWQGQPLAESRVRGLLEPPCCGQELCTVVPAPQGRLQGGKDACHWPVLSGKAAEVPHSSECSNRTPEEMHSAQGPAKRPVFESTKTSAYLTYCVHVVPSGASVCMKAGSASTGGWNAETAFLFWAQPMPAASPGE